MGIDMLLIDSQSTMMPTTVNVNRLATHQPNLKAGSVYSLAPRTPVTCSGKGFSHPNVELSTWFRETDRVCPQEDRIIDGVRTGLLCAQLPPQMPRAENWKLHASSFNLTVFF
ncbi:Uncharacterized protein Rs2_14417 [Raphanus sativus]|nr:Uncharacterized protein Rs2_14417 [Raphanus sativus]